MATLTQVLDGARYDGMLDTGTTSVYAMRFRRSDGSSLYALWNLRGSREVEAAVASGGQPSVRDTFNREVVPQVCSGTMNLRVSDLPIYVTGCTLTAVEPLKNVPDPVPQGTIIAGLDNHGDWTQEAARNSQLEAPLEEWRGMPKVKGEWSVGNVEVATAPHMPFDGEVRTLSFRLLPQKQHHGLIPRYISLSIAPGKEIPIPKGTTRLGLWLHGRNTWAQVKIGIKDSRTGERHLLLHGDTSSQMTDNFDGWRFVDTGDLGEAVSNGCWRVDRLVVIMPEQQVYVKDLMTTADPEIAVARLTAVPRQNRPYTYLPW